MNKQSLIWLGAFCQQYFNMQPGFKIYEVPMDYPNTIRVPIEKQWKFSTVPQEPNYTSIEYDEVKLEMVGKKPVERMMVGYSRRTNVLVMKDPMVAEV